MLTRVEAIQPPRFLCGARWRCLLCDTPWLACRTLKRATGLAITHVDQHQRTDASR